MAQAVKLPTDDQAQQAAAPPGPKKSRRRRRIVVAVLLLVLALELPQLFGETTYFTSSIANLVFHNNFHVVVPGKVYRSAQMSDSDLESTIKRYGIKSVIDLRLDHRTQEAAVDQAGATLYSVPLAGSRFPSRNELGELVSAFDSAKTPVLVHCSSGSHRSAFASAFWLMYQEGKDASLAQEQFNWRAGFFSIERHFRSWLAGRPTIDQFLPQLAEESRQSGEDFRTFVKNYVAGDPKATEAAAGTKPQASSQD